MMAKLQTNRSIQELAEWMADGQEGSVRWTEGLAEFKRREMELLRSTAAAQIQAANSETEAAEAAQAMATSSASTAKYTLWAALAAAASALLSLITIIYTVAAGK